MAIGLDVGSYAAECVAIEVQGKEIVVSRVSAADSEGMLICAPRIQTCHLCTGQSRFLAHVSPFASIDMLWLRTSTLTR